MARGCFNPLKTFEIITSSNLETERAGERLAPLLRAGDVIAFYGDLGAGKTTFVKGLAKGMGASQLVSSPTFVIMHIYEGRLPVYHFDAYRLQGADELINIGAEEYIGTDGVACIEWSEKVESLLPVDCLRLELSYCGSEERKLTFKALQGRGLEIIEALEDDSQEDRD